MPAVSSHSPVRQPRPASVMLAAACLALASRAAPATAQTVSPPIAEYQQRARSSFQLINSGIYPLSVVLEVRGFRVTEQGEVQDLPLDTSVVHVKLSAMSFRIPPRGKYTVFYEARADTLPAWFTIVSALSGARTDTGLNLRILLPHVVYLNQKTPLRKEQVTIRSFAYDTATGKLRIELQNLGPNLGRVQQVTATADKVTSQPGAGFPLFPYAHRWTTVDWPGPQLPTRVSVRFSRFSVDTLLPATRSP